MEKLGEILVKVIIIGFFLIFLLWPMLTDLATIKLTDRLLSGIFVLLLIILFMVYDIKRKI